MSILPIGNIESRSAALYFARQEREVHLPSRHENRGKSICYLTNERRKLFELSIRERRSAEPHRIVRLWAGTADRSRAIPAFIDTLIQRLEMIGTVDPKDLGGRTY